MNQIPIYLNIYLVNQVTFNFVCPIVVNKMMKKEATLL